MQINVSNFTMFKYTIELFLTLSREITHGCVVENLNITMYLVPKKHVLEVFKKATRSFLVTDFFYDLTIERRFLNNNNIVWAQEEEYFVYKLIRLFLTDI